MLQAGPQATCRVRWVKLSFTRYFLVCVKGVHMQAVTPRKAYPAPSPLSHHQKTKTQKSKNKQQTKWSVIDRAPSSSQPPCSRLLGWACFLPVSLSCLQPLSAPPFSKVGLGVHLCRRGGKPVLSPELLSLHCLGLPRPRIHQGVCSPAEV